MAAGLEQNLQLDDVAHASAVRKVLETSHPAVRLIAFAELQNVFLLPITY